MFEPRDETQARRLCRVYLKLFDAAPSGATVGEIDAHGPCDAIDRRGHGDADMVRRVLDDGLLDRSGSRNGATLYELPPKMREIMGRVHGRLSLAERLREILTRADADEEVPESVFRTFEREIRMGPW